MRFNKLLATLRNGMVSPRLRGRQDSKESTFSAETFENFIVDKVGGSNKRFGLKNIDGGSGRVKFSSTPTPTVEEFDGYVTSDQPLFSGNGVFSNLPESNFTKRSFDALENSYVIS